MSFFVSDNSFSNSFILAKGLQLDKHKYRFSTTLSRKTIDVL